MGYTLKNGLSALDAEYLKKVIETKNERASSKNAAKSKMQDINTADPRPARTPLRQRIAEIEKSTGERWNGKIYGEKGSWSFYVANKKYMATDSEVAIRQQNLLDCAAWDKKYAAEIAAAK